MNWIEQFAPGSYFGRLALQVIAQVTGVILVAAVLSATLLERRAAVRHRLWLCCLACILLSPAVAIGLDCFGIALEMIPWAQSLVSATENNVATVGDLQPDASASPAWEVAAYVHEAPDPGTTEPAVKPIDLSSSVPASSPVIEDLAMERLPVPSVAPATAMQRGVAPNRRQVALGGLVLLWGSALRSVWCGSCLPGDASAGSIVHLRHSTLTITSAFSARFVRRSGFSGCRMSTLLEKFPGRLPSASSAGVSCCRARSPDRSHRTSFGMCWFTKWHTSFAGTRWFALLQRIAGVLYWPHPLVHWLNVRLARLREEVCDNFVLRSGDPCEYAARCCNFQKDSSPRSRSA